MSNIKLIRPTELANLLGISKVTLWRMENRGELPARIRISRRAVGWKESDIEEWLDNRPSIKEDSLKEG